MKKASPDLSECWELVATALAGKVTSPLTKDTALFGSAEALLDSMGAVEMIFLLEDLALRRFGIELKIGLGDLLAARPAPFATAGSLCEFLQQHLARA